MMSPPAGRVLTFYSYKGGTGRSMALANTAWILAANGKRVLCIDWDLEAPGLHRYFAPFLLDPDLFSSDGIIDFVWTVAQEMVTPVADTADAAGQSEPIAVECADLADIGDYIIRLDWEFPGDGVLDLIPAGRQGPAYADRVNAFDWDHFYDQLGGGRALNGLRAQLVQEYDFILIDSRTGISDTSGICTVQLPDALVVLFTLNKQSMRGAEAVAQSVRSQRHDLLVFPVPTRVDPFETDKLRAALRSAKRLFAPFVEHLTSAGALSPERAHSYWGDVEFPYTPYFAYEEVLAPFADERGRRASVLAAATRLATHVTGLAIEEPAQITDEVREHYVAAYAHEAPAGAAPVQAAVSESLRAPPKPESPRRRRARAMLLAAAAVAVIAIGTMAPNFLSLSGTQPVTRAEKLAMLRDSATSPERRQALVLELYAESRDLEGVDASGLDLSGLTLTGVNLRNAVLRDAQLTSAVLDSAILAGADLTRTDLTNATLVAADLSGARLDSTRLAGTNLFGATLHNVALDSAITNALTVLNDSTMGPYSVDEDIPVQSRPTGQVGTVVTAYIWIGNFNRRRGSWDKALLGDSAGTPVSTDPALIDKGRAYHVLGNLSARAGFPANDAAYFGAVASLGWLPRGSRVTLRSQPREYLRPSGLRQYWAEVDVDPVSTPIRTR